jgi:6-pyruvoyltetrahydropterin/6-carboxytetrahydropterin synthase
MYPITRTFEFAAGHHLTKVAPGHKCRRPHGHNYVVTIEAQATRLDRCDMVIDYAALDEFAAAAREKMDHQELNGLVGFETTAENLACAFYGWGQEFSTLITAVTVCESGRSSATYRP